MQGIPAIRVFRGHRCGSPVYSQSNVYGPLMNGYLSFLLYLVAILGFVGLTLWMNKVVGPKPESSALKLEPFECGATPIETDNMKAVPVKYYAIAIVFILFDLETVFLYLWALAAQPMNTF